MADFDDYLNLYDKGAYREAYAVLRDIIESEPRWSEVGDLYVMCADLELLVNDDVCKAQQLLDKARELGCSDMADYYRIHGYVLWRTGERDKGMQDVEKSIALDPRVSNLTTLGRMLSFIDSERAMNVWQRVLEKDPKNCLAHICIGEESAKSGDPGKALLMAKRAEKLNPSVDNIFEIGQLYHELKECQIALNAYQEANRRGYADKAILYASIAACYFSLDDYDEAIEYASMSVDLNFNDEYAKDVLLGAAEQEGAAPISDRLIEEHRDTCLAFVLLAQKALKQKDSSKAHKMLSKAKQLEPSPVEMYYIGRLYHVLGRWEKALNIYLESEKLGYDNRGKLYTNIAGCYSCLESSGAAIQYASMAIGLNFNDDYAKDVLLWFTEDEGARPIVDRLIEEHRDTCLAFVLLAQKAIKQKDFTKACDMIAKAEQLNPSPAEMYNIAHLYHDLGQLDKALKACLESERLGYKSRGRLYTSIADCYYSLDDYDAAIQYAIKALTIEPGNDDAKDVLYACRKQAWGSEFGDNY